MIKWVKAFIDLSVFFQIYQKLTKNACKKIQMNLFLFYQNFNATFDWDSTANIVFWQMKKRVLAAVISDLSSPFDCIPHELWV